MASKIIKALAATVQIVWTLALIALGATLGATYGWEHHGWLGAIVLGTIGFGAGAFVSAMCSPLEAVAALW